MQSLWLLWWIIMMNDYSLNNHSKCLTMNYLMFLLLLLIDNLSLSLKNSFLSLCICMCLFTCMWAHLCPYPSFTADPEKIALTRSFRDNIIYQEQPSAALKTDAMTSENSQPFRLKTKPKQHEQKVQVIEASFVNSNFVDCIKIKWN